MRFAKLDWNHVSTFTVVKRHMVIAGWRNLHIGSGLKWSVDLMKYKEPDCKHEFSNYVKEDRTIHFCTKCGVILHIL